MTATPFQRHRSDVTDKPAHSPIQRRAYRPDGTMIQPATVGGEMAKGAHLAELHCAACHHEATIAIDDLPPDLAIPDIGLRAVCTKCGSREVMSRMCIREFYRINAGRGR